jgi:hypothetical protein
MMRGAPVPETIGTYEHPVNVAAVRSWRKREAAI